MMKIHNILKDPFYKDATENSASYNTRLCLERKMRLPFLDAQTGVAQSDCALWMARWQRMPGRVDGQLYSYPARVWRKKRRQYLFNDLYLTRRIKDSTDITETEGHTINVVENITGSRMELEEPQQESNTNSNKTTEDSKDSWYNREFEESSLEPTLDMLPLPPCEPLVEEPDTEPEEHMDEAGRKKKKKAIKVGLPYPGNTDLTRHAQGTRGRKRADKFDYTDMEKPYSCEICGARYKTRPGLSYHYAHGHNDNAEGIEEEMNYFQPPKPLPPPPPPVIPSNWLPPPPVVPEPPPPPLPYNPGLPPPPRHPAAMPPKTHPSPYCDFCLGDNQENKKTHLPEELTSCADCGRSAHPSCLQFTPNMTVAVKRYRWQCIECKSCGICGTSDNDDQLLFCDDCDRGYHMYCLNPPLRDPPEGSWSCHLCIIEFGRK